MSRVKQNLEDRQIFIITVRAAGCVTSFRLTAKLIKTKWRLAVRLTLRADGPLCAIVGHVYEKCTGLLLLMFILFYFCFLRKEKNEVTNSTRGVDGFIKSDLIKFVINLPGFWRFGMWCNCLIATLRRA